MKLLGSLTNRIFIASAALAVVSIGAAVYFVSRTTTREAEAELQRGLIEAGSLVDQQTAALVRTLTVMARLVADSPRFKAAVDTDDPPTVQPFAEDIQKQLDSALVVVTNQKGELLAASAGALDASPSRIAAVPEIQTALAGKENSGFWALPDGAMQVISMPITIGLARPDLLGTLTVGYRLDDALAEQFKRETQSDIAFGINGEIKASTLADRAGLTALLNADQVQTISVGGNEYVGLRRPLAPGSASAASASRNAPTVLLLRSRTERLRFLNAIHTGLAAMAIVAVFAATILSYAVARTITRPLAAITDTMREMAKTGDLARKISLRRSGSWEDEDAKLLAATFNTLTDSIDRFQREAAQRERLSALGRLSTVVAHEIRNPLMIIKGSLRTLAKGDVSRDEIRQALKDVDEEVARLNRVVNDVLDFARPIRFDYSQSDINALCADAEQATREVAGAMTVAFNPDPSLKPVVIDGERLRTALVNILDNARHAVSARSERMSEKISEPDLEIRTMNGAAGRVAIVIRDRGIGVKPEDMPRVFDPYFTTKRTGTGLGLAIAKNIIEGMGGSITLESRAGVGTEIRIDLPSAPPPSAVREREAARA